MTSLCCVSVFNRISTYELYTSNLLGLIKQFSAWENCASKAAKARVPDWVKSAANMKCETIKILTFVHAQNFRI